MSEEKRSNQESLPDYDDYREHRNLLDTIRREQRSTFDKQVLTLSTAALGFSVALLSFFYQKSPDLELRFIVISWIAFVLAISFNLFSYNTAELALKREIDDLDRQMVGQQKISEVNSWQRTTSILNTLVAIAFIVGAVGLLGFAYTNAEAGKLQQQISQTPFDNLELSNTPSSPSRLQGEMRNSGSNDPVKKDMNDAFKGPIDSNSVPTGMTAPSQPVPRPAMPQGLPNQSDAPKADDKK
ncbi:hypothetical protein [Phyllobacterium bourgognense]|uniref:Uncharacterized protein n=1 Tax=Phyllobacterium bourgognense TaxID=314236 RepID=A0A368Z0K6_9HYPH|nr:hypothetical protein [Phyllobacterium bourgognense]RCW85449.1 hypothetical protein C7476_103292 [Phyllobacterium bourgognense]